MSETRRTSLDKIEFSASVNVGLWLDKFLADDDALKAGGETSKYKLLEDASRAQFTVSAVDEYSAFFDRRRAALEQVSPNVIREIEIDGRMICGLGGASVWENSISIHRTYGVPYVPGSSLKGVAASFARNHVAGFEQTAEAYELLFGSQRSAGFVTFHDGLLLPESTTKQFLHQEVMTVHHPEYYGNKVVPPADWDSPIPVGFLSASGKYLLALTSVEGGETWLTIALRILKEALENEGVGAKTSSGYGRAKFIESAEEKAEAGERWVIDDFKRRVGALRANDVPGQINGFFKEWEASSLSSAGKRELATAIVERINKDWKNGRSKEWYKKLQDSLAGD